MRPGQRQRRRHGPNTLVPARAVRRERCCITVHGRPGGTTGRRSV